MSAGPGFSKPHIECPKCERIVTDEGDQYLSCECGEVLRWREPINEPCKGCGGKHQCFCVPDKD